MVNCPASNSNRRWFFVSMKKATQEDFSLLMNLMGPVLFRCTWKLIFPSGLGLSSEYLSCPENFHQPSSSFHSPPRSRTVRTATDCAGILDRTGFSTRLNVRLTTSLLFKLSVLVSSTKPGA